MRIPAGTATLGLARNGGAFGWDNEFEQHTVEVPAFAIDSLNVTNGEFLEFLRAGGIRASRAVERGRVALDPGREGAAPGVLATARATRGSTAGCSPRSLLPLDRPAYVSQAEASAFARGRGNDAADRGAVPSRGLRHPRGRPSAAFRGATGRPDASNGELRLRALGARAGRRVSRRRQRVRRRRSGRERMGVDLVRCSPRSRASPRSRSTRDTRPTSSTESTT